MKLGISELAWQSDTDILDILHGENIRYIEAVIPRHMNWTDDTLTFENYLSYLRINNINVASTQSITYKSNILSFNDINFLNHLKLVSSICKNLHINLLVLGAPKLRNNYELNLLSNIFNQLDVIARDNQQIILLEPNCKQYGGDYFFTIDEIVKFISYNKFTNIKTMIDTHNIINEHQSPAEMYLRYREYIKHVHVSENNLSSFKNSKYHTDLSNVLHDTNYDGIVIYECINTDTLLGDIKLFSNIYNK